MSELKKFITKLANRYADTTDRKLYGLDAIYLKEMPFILINGNENIVLKIVRPETIKKILEIKGAAPFKLHGKVIEGWYMLPDTFNKKKNKLMPILDLCKDSIESTPKNNKPKGRSKVSKANKKAKKNLKDIEDVTTCSSNKRTNTKSPYKTQNKKRKPNNSNFWNRLLRMFYKK